MTYTEAARINAKFNLKWYFRDPKQLGDGVSPKWFKDAQGRVGYVRGCNSEGILVQTLKNHVRLLHSVVSHEDWKNIILKRMPSNKLLSEGLMKHEAPLQ